MARRTTHQFMRKPWNFKFQGFFVAFKTNKNTSNLKTPSHWIVFFDWFDRFQSLKPFCMMFTKFISTLLISYIQGVNNEFSMPFFAFIVY